MSAERCPTRLEMVREDTKIYEYTATRVTDPTTNPLTTTPLVLTSATIRFTAKHDLQDSDADAVFQKTTSSGITITGASTGEFNVKISPSDTADLDGCDGFTDLFYDCQVQLGATNGSYIAGDVITIDSGILTVYHDRTLA